MSILPLPLRMTENEFEYSWAQVVVAMAAAGILREVANEWSGNLAQMRGEFHDYWVDGVQRLMGLGRGLRLDFVQADGRDGVWVRVHDDRRGASAMADKGELLSSELNAAIGTFLREHMEQTRCDVCHQALGTADPDAIARHNEYKHMEFRGHGFAHAKCCGVTTTGEYVTKTGSKWVTLRDLSPRQIVLP